MVRNIFLIFILVLGSFLLLENPAFSQKFEGFNYISIEHGLSQGMIYDQLQDKEGFLWVGTKDGLNRYDGYTFKVFTNDPYNPYSISSNSIVLLYEDSRGLLWIATESAGLNVYNKKSGKFHRFQHKPGDINSISGDKIRTVEEDAEGNMIVAVDKADLNVIHVGEDINGDTFSYHLTRVSLTSGFYVKGIVKDNRGRVWIGGSDNCIYRLEPDDYSLTRTVKGYSFTHAVLDSITGNIYAAASDQTPFLWDGVNVFPLFDELLLTIDLALHPDGTLWIGNYEGLFCFDIKNWNSTIPNRIEDNPFKDAYSITVFSLTIDQLGIVWVGTGGYGLIKINPFKARFNHKLTDIAVRSILPLSKDEFVLGRAWSKWIRLKDNETEHDFIDKILPSLEIDNVAFTRSGDMIAMSVNHFIYLQNRKIKYRIPWERSVLWDKHHILEDGKSRIWIAGFDGDLRLYIPGALDFKFFNYQDPKNPMPPMSPTTAFLIDNNGDFWVGTQSGFARGTYDEKDEMFQFVWFRNDLNNRNSLNYNHVTCFVDDPVFPERYLWICTKGGGLNRFDKRTGDFNHITTRQGLLNDVVYGLVSDESGNLWGSTNRGIFCMSPDNNYLRNLDSLKNIISDPDQYNPKWSFRNFNKSDGLQDDEFNTGAYALLPDGRIAFGGVNGLNIFRSSELFATEFVPNVVITRLLVNNKELTPYDDTGILYSTIETTSAIELNHLQNVVTIEFAALDFTSPMQNKYRYQLVGADPDWVESETRRSATYLHLPPGNYIFRVQGSNSKGVWGDQITELRIKVLPPWWRTWWAYGAYLILAGLGIRTYILFSLNRGKLEARLAYETREAERIKELDVAKTKLYTNITHEFRTPLTIILGMANQIKEKPSEYIQTGLEMIIRNGQSLLKLVNEMLDLSKLESGKMEVNLVYGDVIKFQQYIIESFSSIATSQKKFLHFLPEIDAIYCGYDPEKIRQILSNLLSNGLKFTPEGGHIYMSSGLITSQGIGEDSWFIKIKDTGIGIPEEELNSIFERFYQADSGHTIQSGGTGIGLALTKELVKLMKGEINVESPPPGASKGTQFFITFPVIKEESSKTENIEIEAGKFANPVSSSVFTTIGSNSASYDIPHISPDEKAPLLLLVEDNQDVIAYIASCLQDFRLVVGHNGQEGIEIATNIIPDLIISDVMMPVMDGFDMLKELRKDNTTSHIPVIMLTAKADLESKLEGYMRGADAYLSKPFNREELLLRITKILEMRQKLQMYYLRSVGLAENEVENNGTVEESKPEHVFVQKVRQIIEDHISDSGFDVEKLSKKVHLSYRQLQRKLDALTGCSPNLFIRKIRLNHARTLLGNKELNISDVAMECGFQDPGYFSRVFKQEYGITPAEWRQKADT